MANYNGGFTDGISIRGIPLNVLHPGKVFWVSNSTVQLPNQKTGSNGNAGTFNAPFATLDYAIGQCTAGRGDIICIKPGHAENVSAAASIVVDVAGIAIVGFGSGTLRPKFSWTVAGADMDITAANCSFYNLEFQANVADVTSGIDISGVAGLTFDSCYFTEAGTDLNWVDVIDIATGASDMHFNNCKFIAGDAANDSFITGTNPAISGLYISDCFFTMNVAQTSVEPLIDAGSGALTNVVIKDSHFRSNIDGAKFIYSTSAANSGLISNCYFSSIDSAGAITAGFDFSGGHLFECYVSGEVDTYGLIGGGAAAYNNA
jgi:hypothetical protein